MVLVVIYRYTNASIENAREDLIESEMLSLLITLPNNLGYTYLGNDYNAVDTSRLFNLDLSYLGYKKIIVEQTYPEGNNIECTLNNYPNCDKFVVYDKQNKRLKNKIIKDIPVSLYYPLSNQFKAGRLVIESYH